MMTGGLSAIVMEGILVMFGVFKLCLRLSLGKNLERGAMMMEGHRSHK